MGSFFFYCFISARWSRRGCCNTFIYVESHRNQSKWFTYLFKFHSESFSSFSEQTQMAWFSFSDRNLSVLTVAVVVIASVVCKRIELSFVPYLEIRNSSIQKDQFMHLLVTPLFKRRSENTSDNLLQTNWTNFRLGWMEKIIID